ncbi:NAD(P)-binding protein [Dichomitus squalens]|uniref:NAD(P)-binding protein n=1 Tax=Dichomitus squalens TaxID=114155 RepID=A0A4Q9MK17_9APHY|nr:NAD(P)-binding protein [Dichomitus squalens]
MTGQQPLVLIIGSTGNTGNGITKALVASGNFRVAALIRPSSLDKPAVSELRAQGIEIRAGDIKDDSESLKKVLEGVDILISTVVRSAIQDQRDIFRAAKEVGVQRVIPCDFGSPGARGVRYLHDEKLEIRDFVKELGIPHTFIDVGWWSQLYLPLPIRSHAPQVMKELTWRIYGDGSVRLLVTHHPNIGKYVARIIADPRTLNHAVIVWEDEVSQEEAHEIGERVSGEGDVLKEKRIICTKEDCLDAIAAAEATIKVQPNDLLAHALRNMNQFRLSMHVLGENTLETAKKLGYLDVRELYPDITPLSLEEVAKEFYSKTDPGALYTDNLNRQSR